MPSVGRDCSWLSSLFYLCLYSPSTKNPWIWKNLVFWWSSKWCLNDSFNRIPLIYLKNCKSWRSRKTENRWKKWKKLKTAEKMKKTEKIEKNEKKWKNWKKLKFWRKQNWNIWNFSGGSLGKRVGNPSGGLVTIAGLVLVHINVVVVILDGPVEFVVSGGLI